MLHGSQVCDGGTGHAEVVCIEYDPALVTYQRLLTIWQAKVDLDQQKRTAPLVKPQYRCVLDYCAALQPCSAARCRAVQLITR